MNLKERRQLLGLSRERLAERVGVPVEVIRHWENGTTVPRMVRLPALASALELTNDATLDLFEVLREPRGVAPTPSTWTNIRERRLQLGLSQKQLAKKIGVSREAVCTWELKTRKPQSFRLSRIAKALYISILEAKVMLA